MDKKAILDEIIEYDSPAPLRPDEFTIYQYMERREARGDAPVSRNTANRYLNRLAKEGILTMRQALVEGKWHNAYSVVKDDRGR